MQYDQKIARTYRLEPETVERLKALAEQLQAFDSPLVDLLLSRALDEVEAGRWPLRKEPVKYVVKWRN